MARTPDISKLTCLTFIFLTVSGNFMRKCLAQLDQNLDSAILGVSNKTARYSRQVLPQQFKIVVNSTTSTGDFRKLVWRIFEHRDGKVILKSQLVYDPEIASALNPRPAVLVLHDWDGRDEFENSKAEALARLGYVGYAVDLFGRVGGRPSLNDRLVDTFRKNRPLLLKRLQFAKDEVSKMPFVDKERIGAIGFSFGALGTLDMARAGWNLRGVVSFHGTLGAPKLSSTVNQHIPALEMANITSKILILHGYNDKGVPPAAIRAFEHEMSKRKADWQVHYYANATDFFTKPTANIAGRWMYDPVVDARSWNAMQNFFEELFE